MSAPGRALWATLLVSLAACAGAASAPPAPKTTATETVCDHAKPTACTSTSPSFARDVRPILERRCFACHANGGEAADDHDFSRFATLFAQRRAVANAIATCAMPPQNAGKLPASEADIVTRWISCEAAEQ